MLLISSCPAAARDASPFAQRGYYITFMRMPTYDLADWKRIVDGIHDDGGNTLLLWVAGAFRSQKFPITWGYNADHENVRQDFVRDLIDHAHTRGIKVLLGFTPFGYDGVNQYPLEHPETEGGRQGRQAGRPRSASAAGATTSARRRPESQQFMLEYVREMAFDFYPNADGLLIESSDYAICHCKDCGEQLLREGVRVRRSGSRTRSGRGSPRRRSSSIPHYFSGAEVPGFGVKAAKLPFDPRWTLFFTPHSAHPRARPDQAGQEQPVVGRLARPASAAGRSRPVPGGPGTPGVTGYVPSLEAFTFVATEAEEGQAWLKGRRQVPLGFGWLQPGDPPYDELPMRVNRIAYREFSRNPDLPFERFKEILGREVFGEASTPQAVDDLLALQAVFATERTWCQPSPLVCPERVRAMKERGDLTPKKRGEYRAALDRLRAIEGRHREPRSDGEKELHRIARWVLDRWADENDRSCWSSPLTRRRTEPHRCPGRTQSHGSSRSRRRSFLE